MKIEKKEWGEWGEWRESGGSEGSGESGEERLFATNEIPGTFYVRSNDIIG